jgi:hypothetical protein
MVSEIRHDLAGSLPPCAIKLRPRFSQDSIIVLSDSCEKEHEMNGSLVGISVAWLGEFGGSMTRPAQIESLILPLGKRSPWGTLFVCAS